MNTIRDESGVRARGILLAWLIVAMALTWTARGQEVPPAGAPTTAPSSQQYISREEYERRIDQLLREQERMRQEIDALKRAALTTAPAPPPAVAPATAPAAAPQAPAEAANEEMQNQIDKLKGQVDALSKYKLGVDQFVLAGDAAFGFEARRHDNSSFNASYAPLILYRPADRLLIEAAADIGVSTDSDGNSSTSFDLTIANVSYELTDNLIIGGGLFVVPFGVYHNHFDPPWINKFPDDPLPFGDNGIAPSSEVGVFIKGAVPAGPTKITYDLYVTNGPQLIVKDAGAAGSLNFDDFTDLNGDKAVGGRIGWVPMPDMELGYSIQVSDPQPNGFQRAHATLQAFDFNYRPTFQAISGTLDLRTELILSDVSKETYDPTGALGFGPTRFSNYRQGGYVQLCYRPTLVGNKVLRDLEFVSRYDWLTTPTNAPGGEHEKRFTLGVDYWLAPNAVLKLAYEFDDRKVGQNQDALLIQLGLGL